MSARVLEFPQTSFAVKRAFPHAAPMESLPSRGLQLISKAGHSLACSTQSQANRIVAQVEREIAAQAYARVQQRYDAPVAARTLVPFETPATVAGRILRAVRTFAYSA